MKNLAIIPARKNSKRLLNKNLLSFDDEPLFTCDEAGTAIGSFEKIHLSTDSQKMIDIAEKNGFSIDFIRPKEYATDHAQLNDVVGYVIKKFEEQKNIYDNICLIWPASPLKETSDIIKSYRLLTNKCSSVLGVTDYQISIFSAFFALTWNI